MAQQFTDDPFADSDATPLRVPSGVFRADSAGPIERTGATNARLVLGQPLAALRAVSQRTIVGRLLAVCTIVSMLVVVPLMISGFASVRRAALAAETSETGLPSLVAISPEAQAVLDQLRPIDAAYIASSTISEEGNRDRMQTLVNEVRERVFANDANGARPRMEEAIAYFVSVYSQGLPAQVDLILEDYPYSEEETDERIEQLKGTIVANAQGQDLTALVAAVVELPQRVGDAMNQHLGNRITYVPPQPTQTQQPTAPPPATTPPPTEPAPTDPGPTQSPPPQTIPPAPPSQPPQTPGANDDDDDD